MSDSDISVLIADVREQLLYMQELGIDALPVKLLGNADAQASAPRAETSPAVQAKAAVSGKPETTRRPGSRLAALPSLSARTQRMSAVEIESPTTDVPETPAVQTEPVLIEVAPRLEETEDTIETIRRDIGDCTRCKLHTGRSQVVHTTGNFQADLMFIGEAPGADEDAQGVPFVGRAGQLLTKIIESIGLRREDVCIGNVNRCRPPGNRQPEPDEAATCRPFLLREIAVIRPKVIVVLGAHAAQNLLQVKTPISRLRGNFHDYFGVKVMPTFHPAYLLRDPHKKREVWEDMKKVRDHLRQNQ